MEKMMQFRVAAAIALLLAAVLPAIADTAAPTPPPVRNRPMQRGGLFPMQDGEAIYKGVCQGCHMPDAKGAVGAGAYPALASNENLETAGYPIGVIVKGQKAMPSFAEYFDDQQIANVVNYVRTHFGNKYRDKVKPEDVKLMR
jgi:mono/diheme cytochrome c family protein